MHHRLILGFMVATALGCGSNNDNSVSVNNMNPVGTVGGIVVDAATEMPISGAAVSLLSAGTTITAMTDSSGHYTLKMVPAGTFHLTVTMKGYATALVDDELKGAVGNFPVANPTHTVQQLGLVPTSGTFAVRLVDAAGNAVPMVTLTARTNVRQFFYSDGQPQPQGTYQVTAMSGMDGTATFMGLPAYATLTGLVDDTLSVTVPPIQMMGSYTFLGNTVTFHVNGLTTSVQTINIAGPTTPLEVIDSNIEYLKGRSGSNPPATSPLTTPVGSEIAVGGPITMSFNQAIDPSSLQAVLLDENGSLVSVTMMPTVSVNLLSLAPSTKLAAGHRYNLVLHVVAAPQPRPGSSNPMAEFDATAPIFTQPAAGSNVTVVGAHLVTNMAAGFQYVQVTFSEPIGLGLGQTAGYALDCAAFFEPPSGSGGFNNDPNTVFQGDWKTTATSAPPQNLVCRQPVGGGVAPQPYMNVTQLQSMETSNNGTTPLTGFSDTWQIPVDVAAPPMTGMSGPCEFMVACTKVGTNTKLHLIFSRQAGIGVKRADGTPVPDNITSAIVSP